MVLFIGDIMNKKIVFVLISLIIISFAQRVDSIVRVGACATPGSPRDIVVCGGFAYVADAGGLGLVDVSAPNDPILTAYNGTIFMEAEGVYVKDTLAFINCGGAATFTIAVVKPPDTITRIGYRQCAMSTYPLPWGVSVKDSIAYMAGGYNGLWILNISDLTNPTLIDTFNTPGHLLDFYINDTLLYAADRDSFLILNIADPTNVYRIGALCTIPGGVYDVFVDSIYAYLAIKSQTGDDGRMQIVDVSDPTNPQLLGEAFCRGDGHGIFVANGYVYIATQDWWSGKGIGVEYGEHKKRADVEGGIRIFDPETTSNPVLICSYDTPGDPQELWVQGDLIFVADYDSLQILRHIMNAVEEKNNKTITFISKFLVCPNPARYVVTCEMGFAKSCRMTLSVYDQAGRKIKEIYQGSVVAGKTIFNWDGKDMQNRNVPAGTYFVKAKVLESVFQESEKVIYLRGVK